MQWEINNDCIKMHADFIELSKWVTEKTERLNYAYDSLETNVEQAIRDIPIDVLYERYLIQTRVAPMIRTTVKLGYNQWPLPLFKSCLETKNHTS